MLYLGIVGYSLLYKEYIIFKYIMYLYIKERIYVRIKQTKNVKG